MFWLRRWELDKLHLETCLLYNNTLQTLFSLLSVQLHLFPSTGHSPLCEATLFDIDCCVCDRRGWNVSSRPVVDPPSGTKVCLGKEGVGFASPTQEHPFFFSPNGNQGEGKGGCEVSTWGKRDPFPWDGHTLPTASARRRRRVAWPGLTSVKDRRRFMMILAIPWGPDFFENSSRGGTAF